MTPSLKALGIESPANRFRRRKSVREKENEAFIRAAIRERNYIPKRNPWALLDEVDEEGEDE